MKLGRFKKRSTTVDPSDAADVWSDLVEKASSMNVGELQSLSNDAERLRELLDRFDQIAEAKSGSTRQIDVPDGLVGHVEWMGRPNFWLGKVAKTGLTEPESGVALGDGVKLFHDCALREISLRQEQNPKMPNLPPFGLAMDVMRFEGSFLSLVLELPEGVLSGLSRTHVLTVNFDTNSDRPVGIYVRLNLQCGPNTVTMLREVPRDGSGSSVEFDLAYSEMDEARLENGWIDVMFEDPKMLGIEMRDVTLFRSGRAEV